MATEIVEIAVLRSSVGWQVVGPKGSWRSFAYRVDAEEAALRLAAQAKASGGTVNVLVQDSCGRLEALADSKKSSPIDH